MAVLWVTPQDCSGWGAREIIRDSAWAVHLDEMPTEEIARLVGKSASEALGKVGSLA